MPAATGSLFRRLYRGETNFDLVGQRKKWYIASGIIIAICVLTMIFRGFLFGIEFSGGNQYQITVKPGTTLAQMRAAAEATGVTVSSAQTAGQGSTQSYVIRTEKLSDQQSDIKQVQKVRAALASTGHVTQQEVNEQEVSSSWGGEVTEKAIIALVVFLVVVGIFMAFRFRDAKAAGAALLALFHDLLLTAGVYSIVHFEVTPGTVVGLLTILGYSLYDTVVVFDKVDENTRGLLGSTRYTYAEAANLAVNQTLMRSINTSLIGLLPVAGLLFIGAGLLGVGTLRDLALVLFVGMITGAYSSLFLATPWLVDFKLLDPRYRNQAQRVTVKRTADANRAAGKLGTKAAAVDDESGEEEDLQSRVDELATSAAPRVGARPAGAKATGAKATGAKATGAKRAPAGRSSGRPAGGKRRH
jgi:preprotein translocase subunit SecF